MGGDNWGKRPWGFSQTLPLPLPLNKCHGYYTCMQLREEGHRRPTARVRSPVAHHAGRVETQTCCDTSGPSSPNPSFHGAPTSPWVSQLLVEAEQGVEHRSPGFWYDFLGEEKV